MKSINRIGKMALIGSVGCGLLLNIALVVSYTTESYLDFWHATTFAFALLNMAFGAFSGWVITRSVRGILAAQAAVSDISEAKFKPFNTDYDAEIGDMMRALFKMQEQIVHHDQEREQRAEQMSRVKQALDVVNTNVMLTSPSGEVIYANRSLLQSFSEATADFRRIMPSFDADQLLGVNINEFHTNPTDLTSLHSRHEEQVCAGERVFHIVATPVRQPKGEQLGTVIEWTDRSAEIAIEEEVQAIVNAAKDGDLTRSISLEGKQGFFANLASGMNEMVAAAHNITEDTLRVLKGFSTGDLSVSIEGQYSGRFAELKSAANETVERLAQIAVQIQKTAGEVNAGVEQISSGNRDLSVRTETQNGSLKATTTSICEITETVRGNAENAERADELSSSARTQAEEGGVVVAKAEAAMQDINAASAKISAITTVINEIAFQTNLLALNAAVEAARAGEQGKGFAVVASEVRNLAQRSGEAAKEIEELIRDSVEKIEEGTRLVDQSGNKLSAIVTSVSSVSELITSIAQAGRDQTAGIGRVNEAITSMDEITQQNSALVEAASSSSQGLTLQAKALIELVSFFKIADQANGTDGGSSRLDVQSVAASVAAPSVQLNGVKAPSPAVGATSSLTSTSADSEGEDVETWESF